MKFRTRAEIDEEVNKAVHVIDTVGTRWTGMSYEQGVDAALRWVTGESDDAPMGDD